MIKIFKIIVYAFVFCIMQSQIFSYAYLWEMKDDAGASCCLHYGGIDICNPYKPCTKFAKIDLIGILDYLSRLSLTERAKLEPHNKIIVQLKQYIQSVLYSRHNDLLYQVHKNVSVRFYHDVVEEDYIKNKDAKHSKQSETKASKDNFVTNYLVRLGLMQRASGQ